MNVKKYKAFILQECEKCKNDILELMNTGNEIAQKKEWNKYKGHLAWLNKNYLQMFFLSFFILLTFAFSEAIYLYYFNLTFTVMKFIFLVLYSVLLGALLALIKNKIVRRAILFLVILIITTLYFGEALYFNLFKSFALWSQLDRLKELEGIKEQVGSFIDERFLILLVPLVYLIFFYVIDGVSSLLHKKEKAIAQGESPKHKLVIAFVAVLLLAGISLYTSYFGNDPNKLVIRNTLDYERKYSLFDEFIVNSLEPVLKPLFTKSEPTPEQLQAEFGVHKEENSHTNRYKDKNLVFIEGESIAPYAIDPILTPMLYKLQTEGYSFPNYYSAKTNTFTSEFAIMNSFYLSPKKEKQEFTAGNSLGGLFKKQFYATQAFHDFASWYYGRDFRLKEEGFDAFYGAEDLGLDVIEPDFVGDIELFNRSFPYIAGQDRFMAYFITMSAHGGYDINNRPSLLENLSIVQDVYPDYDLELQTYLASAMLTDQGVASLYYSLDDIGKLDDTVIMFTGDHYPYALDDAVLQDTFHITDPLDLYKTPFFIWDATAPAEARGTVMSNVDILPTIANLFDLDLRYAMGKDVFSSQINEIFVEWYDFRGYSFLTQAGGYDGFLDRAVGHLTQEQINALKAKTYRRDEWNNSDTLYELLRNIPVFDEGFAPREDDLVPDLESEEFLPIAVQAVLDIKKYKTL